MRLRPALIVGHRSGQGSLPGRRKVAPYVRTISMKWITREKVKVDRVACPWLIA
jgi:hypothetical protein